MGWPQVSILALAIAGLLIAAIDHGKPERSKVNFWRSLVGWGLQLLILVWGGFFR